MKHLYAISVPHMGCIVVAETEAEALSRWLAANPGTDPAVIKSIEMVPDDEPMTFKNSAGELVNIPAGEIARLAVFSGGMRR
jgi:hypothetical protein